MHQDTVGVERLRDADEPVSEHGGPDDGVDVHGPVVEQGLVAVEALQVAVHRRAPAGHLGGAVADEGVSLLHALSEA